MTPKELQESEKELKKLEERTTELFNWLKNNVSSVSFSEVNRTYNEITIKANTLRERINYGSGRGSSPEMEWSGSIPARPIGFRSIN
jgi:hypothetical protein